MKKAPLKKSVIKKDTAKASTSGLGVTATKTPVKKAVKPATKKTLASLVTTKKANTDDEKFVAHSTSLKAGDKAPNFSAIDQNGKLISLADLKGKKIVLYFYPKDNTPTCALEACSLRDEHAYLAKKNYVVLGVSADDEKMHKKFATKYELPFSLLADTSMDIIRAYDVWGIKKFMGRIYDGIIRTTFIIDEKGMISEVITNVKSKEHGKQVLEL